MMFHTNEKNARHEERNTRTRDAHKNGSKKELKHWRGEGRKVRTKDTGDRQTELKNSRQ